MLESASVWGWNIKVQNKKFNFLSIFISLFPLRHLVLKLFSCAFNVYNYHLFSFKLQSFRFQKDSPKGSKRHTCPSFPSSWSWLHQHDEKKVKIIFYVQIYILVGMLNLRSKVSNEAPREFALLSKLLFFFRLSTYLFLVTFSLGLRWPSFRFWPFLLLYMSKNI